jgi:predicted NBD/HSP70 family sugar kinase
VQGGAGFAGEVGHMPVGDPEARCGCGRRGCWEASIGLHAVLDELGLAELETPLETAHDLARRAQDDPTTRDVLTRVGRDVGLGLAILAGVLDPQVVVLGGYFVPLGDLVLAPAREVLDERLASSVQVRPELRLSTLGIRAAALGAAEQSFDRVLTARADLPAA